MTVDLTDPSIIIAIGSLIVAFLGNWIAMWKTVFGLKNDINRVEGGFKNRNTRIDEDFKEDRERLNKLENFKEEHYKRLIDGK